MRRTTRLFGLAVVVLATSALLAACSAPSAEALIATSEADFAALVDQASAVDVSVLHTLEVEKPVEEACGSSSGEQKHTVFVAAGTTAVQATSDQEQKLLEGFVFEKPSKDTNSDQRWTQLTAGVSADERAYVDATGITAAVKLSDGLLVITVFSPCRA